jgi:lipopolysaccharide transport system permease protein
MTARTHVAEITPPVGWRLLRLSELWEYRELLLLLALRDLQVRYKQTLLGVLWALIQPVATMAIFSLVFSHSTLKGQSGVPYPVFALTGLVIWQLFASSLAQASLSVVNDSRLITKVYFPRLLLPVAATGPAVLDFGFGLAALLVALRVYEQPLRLSLVYMLPIALCTMVCALAVGLWFSALTVRYRDVKYTLNFVLQFWLFASPVAYAAEVVPPRWRYLYGLNPLVGLIESARSVVFGTPMPPVTDLLAPALGTILIFVGGVFYFRRLEISFGDTI